ncbi:MAG TPA: phosphoribosylamine--glycine ligase [Saprospiraceae bacterium]|nr:phosphoribosylamine--glycine ligase [Saprospiraceae bacterium]HRO09405.1 phosphoribosylamine--glycine ligase [Saprospiraceae bacterium]HRP42693.1 phosphoribosylamine--glycine ligase [Saprospiraceae bacterium]
MNILLIGSGGREHALAWKLTQSPLCTSLYIAPGNPGTAASGINVDIKINDFAAIKSFCLSHDISMIVVGPEAPLVDGLTDFFRQEDTKHIGIIGPSAYAAQLEGSKAFAKKFMQKYNIPTAVSMEVHAGNMEEGQRFLESMQAPYVLKADGLAAGKGVMIIDGIQEAKTMLREMLSGKFGKASDTVVIETFLKGIEFSVFALTDGKNYLLLPEAKDYKRIGTGDTGLNTGGMGAVSPVSFADEELWQKVIDRIVKPTISGIYAEKMDYTGFVFFGLINVDGDPYVIEYNCRMGDPETEAVLPRVKSDWVQLLQAAVEGRLDKQSIETDDRYAVTVMLVSGGYPEDYAKNKVIQGLDGIEDSLLFHAGTAAFNGDIVTSGGRVLAVTTLHPDFKEAVRISMQNADKIQYEGKYYRNDIGFDL